MATERTTTPNSPADNDADFEMIPGETITVTRNGDGTFSVHSDHNDVTWLHVGDTFKIARW